MTWAARAPLPWGAGELGLAVLSDGIHAVAGTDGTFALDHHAVYDDTTDAWTMLPDLPAGRSAVAAAELNDDLHVFTGQTGSAPAGGRSDSHWRYDLTSGAWASRAAYPVQALYVRAASLGGFLYGIGGTTDQTSIAGSTTAAVRRYNPGTDSWASVASMNVARNQAAVAVADGKLWVVGGSGTASDFDPLSSAEVYDPGTNTWTNLPDAPVPFAEAIAGWLQDGLLHVVVAQSHYAYDPDRALWLQFDPPGTSRTDAAGVAFDGSLHAIGGANQSAEHERWFRSGWAVGSASMGSSS